MTTVDKQTCGHEVTQERPSGNGCKNRAMWTGQKDPTQVHVALWQLGAALQMRGSQLQEWPPLPRSPPNPHAPSNFMFPSPPCPLDPLPHSKRWTVAKGVEGGGGDHLTPLHPSAPINRPDPQEDRSMTVGSSKLKRSHPVLNGQALGWLPWWRCSRCVRSLAPVLGCALGFGVRAWPSLSLLLPPPCLSSPLP